eukprot:CAMPEP_0195058866 /NCGR_PEP_ID=MMETSP0448-20130528/6522_1 /TAXON_ID=66468 /ORGANISM="Heterocapsa triquestra, Strain CCMP 448" /LENGTH=191 /DNA_ID=CAMNT_0040089049 /DNA_START=268 /DNA_END=842 /DNA_ORIENTATION=+
MPAFSSSWDKPPPEWPHPIANGRHQAPILVARQDLDRGAAVQQAPLHKLPRLLGVGLPGLPEVWQLRRIHRRHAHGDGAVGDALEGWQPAEACPERAVAHPDAVTVGDGDDEDREPPLVAHVPMGDVERSVDRAIAPHQDSEQERREPKRADLRRQLREQCAGLHPAGLEDVHHAVAQRVEGLQHQVRCHG